MDAVSGPNLAGFGSPAELNIRSQAHSLLSGHHAQSANPHENGQADGESAQILSYQRAERTSLFIKTQEGDVVQLKFRSQDSTQAASSELDDGETLISQVELRSRSSTRLTISVSGDLNADELAAIQRIVEQAVALADQFFEGDVGAAFESASALEIDGQQLAKVALRLKVSEQFTYTGQAALAPLLSPSLPPTQTPTPAASVGFGAAQQATVVPNEPAAGIPSVNTAAPPVEAGPRIDPPDVNTVDQPSVSLDTPLLAIIADFLTTLIDTLREIGNSEQSSDEEHGHQESIEFSLKMKIFTSVLLSVPDIDATSDANDVPDLVQDTIDAVVAEVQAPLEEIA